MAPIPSSGWKGTPSLRTTITSNGASRARATSNATGIPPRGNPRTTTSCPRRYRSRCASFRPASLRSTNGMMTSPPDRSCQVFACGRRPGQGSLVLTPATTGSTSGVRRKGEQGKTPPHNRHYLGSHCRKRAARQGPRDPAQPAPGHRGSQKARTTPLVPLWGPAEGQDQCFARVQGVGQGM